MTEHLDRKVDFCAIDLTTECIATHGDIDEVERFLFETRNVVRGDDHPHARAPQRHAGVDPGLNFFIETEAFEQTDYRRRLASRNDEAVDSR